MKKMIKILLPTDIVIKIADIGNKLSTYFHLKDVSAPIYQGRYPETGCIDHQLGETGRKVSERVLNHVGGDTNSHLFKHSVQSGHSVLDMSNYKIIQKGYENIVRKGKIAEAFLIKGTLMQI